MIIVDFSGVFMAAVHTDLRSNDDVNIDFIRHLVMNRLRMYNKKYRKEYGEMVICLDKTHKPHYNWRYDYFDHYKASRSKSREESPIDWDGIYNHINTIIEEMRKYLPYKVVEVKKCEADDLIAVLCENKDPMEKFMIISGDKDMKQLQRYPNVKQFSPITKKQLVEKEPLKYIREHVIRGDGGDGVPNMYSEDDHFVNPNSGRQKAVTKKFLESVLERPEHFIYGDDEELKRKYERNRQMIDLSYIPQEWKDKIQEALDEATAPKANRLYSYFMKNRMNLMLDYIEDFMPGEE